MDTKVSAWVESIKRGPGHEVSMDMDDMNMVDMVPVGIANKV